MVFTVILKMAIIIDRMVMSVIVIMENVKMVIILPVAL
jgi:hypothetical protein